MKKNNFIFNQVTIIGVGLIGGSLGLAIKKKRLARQVIGFSRRQKTISQALKLKAIDKGTLDLNKAIKGSDLIVLATPAETIIKLAKLIAKIVKEDCIVTDVGSCKAKIIASLEKNFPKNIKFIGGHPLAGSEKKGVVFACPDMFVKSLCILTPTKKTDLLAFKKIKTLWQRLGADIKILSPLEHDKILAFVSHLPHFISFSLIQSVPDKFLKFAPQGLKDMTRIASSDPIIWRDIFSENKKQLLSSIDKFETTLKKIRKLIRSSNGAKLVKVLADIKNKRDNLK